jgi:hypothetical protein
MERIDSKRSLKDENPERRKDNNGEADRLVEARSTAKKARYLFAVHEAAYGPERHWLRDTMTSVIEGRTEVSGLGRNGVVDCGRAHRDHYQKSLIKTASGVAVG